MISHEFTFSTYHCPVFESFAGDGSFSFVAPQKKLNQIPIQGWGCSPMSQPESGEMYERPSHRLQYQYRFAVSTHPEHTSIIKYQSAGGLSLIILHKDPWDSLGNQRFME